MILVLLTFCVVFSQKYNVQGSVEKTKNGFKGVLQYESSDGENFNPPDIIDTLSFQFFYETKDRVRLVLKDDKKDRWEVPGVVISETPSVSPSEMNYEVSITDSPFCFKIVRKSDNYEVFNTDGFDLFFADQYISVTTSLGSTNPNIYGIGERKHNFRLDPKDSTYVIFNKDQGTPVDKNLYGTHPFYLELLDNGKSHGVFILNSNAQEFNINGQSKSITYRTIGGILDMYFFMGDSPKDVVNQYQDVIGKPFLPPLWSLGYHQCRWGYKTIQETADVVTNFAKYDIPLETMWNDIDFMDQYEDWTVDPVNYPLSDFQNFITSLHDNNQHYMQILDPGIHYKSGYEPYDRGEKLDIFIKQNDGVHDLINKVWPGLCVFPDLYNPDGAEYFTTELENWYKKLPMDGQWIDMNEPSGFCDGQCVSSEVHYYEKKIAKSGTFDPMNPPYVPGGDDLNDHTLRMDGVTHMGIQYNTHSLYGFEESKIVSAFLEDFWKKRAFVITRSTFAGNGRYTGHWLGDNVATFEDLFYSISGCLSMSIFGISICGADICGFGTNTTSELCTRWYEVGAFYTFMRNHNSEGLKAQEPYALGQQVLNTSKKMIHMRYDLLPYLYTMLADAHISGDIVFRPIFFEFNSDSSGYLPYLDAQFMWGAGLLVNPVTTEGATTVNIYVPDAEWYDYYTYDRLVPNKCQKVMEMCTLDAPLGFINVFYRGGVIVPKKVSNDSSMTTYEVRKYNAYEFVVPLDKYDSATGSFYVDDGETINAYETGKYSRVNIVTGTSKSSSSGQVVLIKFSTDVVHNGYSGGELDLLRLDNVRFLGVNFTSVSNVMVQGKAYSQYTFDASHNTLLVHDLKHSLLEVLNIQFQ